MLLVAGARRVGVGTLTVGTVAAFLQLLRRFYQPLQDLADKFNTLQQAMAASERIFLLLDTPAEFPSPVPAASAIDRNGVVIAFEGVWFHYGEPSRAPAWVRREVSFVAPPGEPGAPVGHPGGARDH